LAAGSRYRAPGVVLLESGAVTRAVEIFGTRGIDFADAYLIALAQESKTTTVAAFDNRGFGRFEWLKLVPEALLKGTTPPGMA